MALKRFLMIGFVAALVACGDDDSSDFATRPSGDSSSACEDCDGSSSSKAKSSDSETSVSSSSSAKSSSSASSSSSKDVESVETSSSSSSVDSSSSSAKSSSSVASSSSVPEGYVDPSTVVKGTMTDERDGQTYKTVKIGTQTWTAENLNYRYIQQTAEEDSSSYCYNDDPANCAKYGRLYLWSAAMDSVGIIPGNTANGCGYGEYCNLGNVKVRGVCPEGWHLPTEAEWIALFNAVGGKTTAGKMLKSTEGWNDYDGTSGNGSDAYFFSALPAGNRLYNGGFDYEGDGAYFWSSTEYTSINAYDLDLYCYDVRAYLYHYNKSYGFSVRCLMD